MPFEPKSVTINSNYTVKYGNQEILVDSSLAPVTITVVKIGNGAQQADTGYSILIKDIASSASKNAITIVGTGGDNIENGTSYSIDEDGGYSLLISNGSSNWVLEKDNRVSKTRQLIILPFTNDIDGKTIGVTNILNIPQGRQAVFSGLDLGIKSLTGSVTGFGTIKVQTNTGTDLSTTTILTGLDAVGKLITINPTAISRIIVGIAGGTKIQLNVTTAFTVGTSITLTGFIKGYFIN